MLSFSIIVCFEEEDIIIRRERQNSNSLLAVVAFSGLSHTSSDSDSVNQSVYTCRERGKNSMHGSNAHVNTVSDCNKPIRNATTPPRATNQSIAGRFSLSLYLSLYCNAGALQDLAVILLQYLVRQSV